MKCKRLLLLSVLLGCCGPVSAATTVWNNSTANNQFGTAANWSAGVPTVADDAVFPVTASTLVNLAGAAHFAKSLQFNNSSHIFTSSGGSLTVGQAVDQSGAMYAEMRCPVIFPAGPFSFTGNSTAGLAIFGDMTGTPAVTVSGGRYSWNNMNNFQPTSVNCTGGELIIGTNASGPFGLFVTGPVTVNGGVICVQSVSIAIPGWTVNSGMLKANTTLLGTVTVNSGSFTGGCSPGTANVQGDLVFGPGGSAVFELDPAGVVGGVNDLISVETNLTLNGVMQILPGASFGPGTYRLFDVGGTIVNNGATLAGIPSGLSAQLNFATPGQVNLLVTSTTQNVQILTLTNTPWAYNDTTLSNTALHGTGWELPGYNTNSAPGWKTGRSLFGNDSAGIYDAPGQPFSGGLNGFATPLDRSGNRVTFYFRTQFLWAGPLDEDVTLVATNYFDDGAVIYLNGAEAGRVRMGTSPVEWSTLAANLTVEGVADVLMLPTTNLVVGQNTVAVEVHQTSAASSDVAFAMSLQARFVPCPLPVITCPSNRSTNILGTSVMVQYASPTVSGGTLVGCTPASGSVFALGTTPVVCTATNGCGTNTCSFNVTVTTNAPPPSITITSPTNGQSFRVGDNATVQTATPNPSAISFVQFYLDGVFRCDTTNSPFEIVEGDLEYGSHTITVVAIGIGGLSVTSAPVTVTVTNETGFSYLVPNGSIWKYFDNGSDQGTAWRAPGFSDSSWNSGQAELGFGDISDSPPRPERTVINGGPATNRVITTYFRHTFNVPNPGAYSNLIVRLMRDDGGVAYLNGVEVFRSNMPTGAVNFTTLAFNTVDDGTYYFSSTNLSPALLVAGQNLLAVEIHQDTLTSSDMSFDAMLLAQDVGSPPCLAAHWPMEGSVTDIVGANQPSATAGLSFVPGKIGQGVTFAQAGAGVGGGYIEIPHAPALANQRFTFEAWVRPNGIGPNDDAAGSVIIQKTRDLGFGYTIWWRCDGKFTFGTGASGSTEILSAHNFPAGCFYHVAGTYDGVAFKLYVNGNLEGQRASSAPIDYTGSYPWTIGATPQVVHSLGVPRTWNGVIDEVKIWCRALSAPEVQAAFIAGGPDGLCLTNPCVTICATNKTVPCGTAWNFDPPTSSCTNVTITVLDTRTNGTCPVVIERTWSVTDTLCHSTTCTQLVTVVDTASPVFANCPTNAISLGCNPPPPTCANVLALGITASDVCSGSIAPVCTAGPVLTNGPCGRSQTFALTATDACTNQATCFVTYTWTEDTTPPMITCASNKTVQCGIGNAARLYYPYGVAVDSAGNVYVADTYNHTIRKVTPAGVVTTLAGLAGSPGSVDTTGSAWSFDDPAVSDICCTNVTVRGLDTVTNGPCPMVITRTWEARDCCGNTATCSQRVTVVDTNAPVFANCPTAVINLGCNPPPPNCTNVLALGIAASDVCSGNITPVCTAGPVLTNGPCGRSQTFTLTATDACTNQATCTVTYNWTVDTTPPVLVWPSSVNLVQNGSFETGVPAFNPANQLLGLFSGSPDLTGWTIVQNGIAPLYWANGSHPSSLGTAYGPAADGDLYLYFNGSYDNSTPRGKITTSVAFSSAGTYRLEYDLWAEASINGSRDAGFTAELTGLFSYTDLFTLPFSLTATPPSVTAANWQHITHAFTVSAPGTYTLSFTDASVYGNPNLPNAGNTPSPMLDHVSITEDCCGTTRTVECGTPWSFATPTAFDTCCTNVTLTSIGFSTGNACSNANTIVWTATDCCSNRTTCTQTVIVVSTKAPTLICPTNFLICTNDQACGPMPDVAGYITVSAFCGSVTIQQSISPGAPVCANTGPFSVQITVSDACGHTTNCTVPIALNRCCVDPPSGMVNWWPFDEPNGSRAPHDIAGLKDNVGNLTPGGSTLPSFVPGKVGNAICFNGVDQWMQVSFHSEINFNGNCKQDQTAESFTIDAWIKTDQATGAVMIIDKRLSSPLQGYALSLTNGFLRFELDDTGSGNPHAYVGSVFVADNQWNFIAVTYERCANILKMYVNGGLTPADTFLTPTLGGIGIGAFMRVGRADPGFPPDFYHGCIDELEFFKRVLNTNEINSIWAADSAGKCKPGANLPRYQVAATSMVAGQLRIEWSGDAVLQSADSINGPWTDMPDAISGSGVDVNGSRMFFRLRYP